MIVLLCQAGSSAGLIPARSIASPLTILGTSWTLLSSGELLQHELVSLGRISAGLALAVTVGAGLAPIAGLPRRGEDLIDAAMQMLRTLSFLALVPLFIPCFGIGETPKIALVPIGSAFPIYLALFGGIAHPDAIEAKGAALQDFIGRLAGPAWATTNYYAASWIKLDGLPEQVAPQNFARRDARPLAIDDAVVADEQRTIDPYLRAGLIHTELDANDILDRSFNDPVLAELNRK